MDEETETHQPMFRSLSYSLPPPHRLGSSSSYTSLRLPRGLAAVATPTGHTPSTTGLHQLSTSLGLQSTSETEGTDETDAGRELGRKAPLSAGARAPRAKTARIETVVKHSGGPLTEFALFMPPKLPAAITRSRYALLEFIESTSSTYLGLWEFAKEMRFLDLRLPAPYAAQLSEEHQFLAQLLCVVVEKLSNVKSIAELYVPQVVLRSHTKLTEILQPLAKSGITIGHVLIPVKCSLQESDLATLDYKPLASLLHRSGTKELTVISSAPAIPQFQKKLREELNKLKSSPNKAVVKVNHSSNEVGNPGPAYITELDVKPAVGEPVDPHTLVSSLNFGRDGREAGKREEGRARSSWRRKSKTKATGAFSTDCTYAEEAELTTDGPFVSEIWKLEQLHDKGIDGSGMTVAVIDSGINYTHAAFKGKIVAVRNFVEEEIDNVDCAIDSDGHGTLCAGIAAGSSFYCPIKSSDSDSPCIRVPPGAAPGAKLVICKVVRTSDGDVDSKAFLASLKWLKDLHSSGSRIDVVSISLASTYHSHPRAEVISELTNMGVIVVCCASNVGRLRLQPIAFPARLGHVLCIGAHDENGKPTSFSPVGRELDFLAPGDDIWGPGPGTIGPFAMDCASGTSCATPAVAGLVCLVLQEIARISELDPETYEIGGKPLVSFARNVWVMREILKEMSSSPGHHSDEIGYGTLNPYRVLDRSPEEIMRLINEIVEDE